MCRRPFPFLPAVLLLCLWIGAPSALHAQTSSAGRATWDSLATEVKQNMEARRIVGGTVWLVHDGQVSASEHHGFAGLDPRRPIDDETIFHWASITKTLTGIAIMQLRDQGRLTLDDPVVDYLPSLGDVHNPYGSMDEITIRMLLRHRGGFRTPTWPWAGDKSWHPHEPTDWSQLVAMMPYSKIHVEPGTTVKYSNPGFVFLGQIVEQLSGESYEVYVDKNIFTPLRMDRSYFDKTPTHLRRHRSNNYTISGNDTTAHGLDFDTGITAANGGLNAPVGDMVKYTSFLTGNCSSDACRRVLDRSSLQEMWRLEPAEAPDSTETPTDSTSDEASGIGLSFFVDEEWGEERIVGHTGQQKSFVTSLWIDPDANVATLAAFNTTREEKPRTFAVMRNFQQQVIKDVFPAFF